jgi:DNA-directed RNA polymerase subunit RPC12/RpoP
MSDYTLFVCPKCKRPFYVLVLDNSEITEEDKKCPYCNPEENKEEKSQ